MARHPKVKNSQTDTELIKRQKKRKRHFFSFFTKHMYYVINLVTIFEANEWFLAFAVHLNLSKYTFVERLNIQRFKQVIYIFIELKGASCAFNHIDTC